MHTYEVLNMWRTMKLLSNNIRIYFWIENSNNIKRVAHCPNIIELDHHQRSQTKFIVISDIWHCVFIYLCGAELYLHKNRNFNFKNFDFLLTLKANINKTQTHITNLTTTTTTKNTRRPVSLSICVCVL
jgi:hypothetical protein